MATYSVRLYQNSGFNAVNIPDSPELLNTVAFKDTDAIEILQQRWLQSIDVKAMWADVKDCDYVRVDTFYYFVNGVTMLSAQTARIALIPDYITSSGGLKNPKFKILDGITDRATVAETNDIWGAYTEEDPLLAPQKPLQIKTAWGQPEGGNPSRAYTFLETTLDVPEQSIQLEGDTYKDVSGGECTVPKTFGISGATSYDLNDDDTVEVTDITNETTVYQSNSDETIDITQSSGTTLKSEPFKDTVKRGFSRIRSLGIEGGIIDQWRVPEVFVGDTTKISEPLVATDEDGNTILASDQRYQVISGGSGSCIYNKDMSAEYATVKNKRLLYGEYNKYGLMTTAGNSMEAKPEEIMDSAGNPEIAFRSDPRPDGSPFYRFKSINGDTEFWRNCVAGEHWQKVPFVYQGASGTALNRLNYDNQRYISNLNRQYADTSNQQAFIEQMQGLTSAGMKLENAPIASALGTAGGIMGAIAGIFGGNNAAVVSGTNLATAGMLSGINAGIDQAYNDAQKANAQTDYTLQANQVASMYEAQRENELSQLYQSNLIYVPTVNFPYNASILRDVKGNGFFLYKYYYSDMDIKRLDKLLTMYGYKESEPLTVDNFNRRPKFDYVACSAVSVTGFPKWFNDGIATQLRTGIRIWHVLPDPEAYDNNTKES